MTETTAAVADGTPSKQQNFARGRNVAVKGERGLVYGPLDIDIPRSELTLIVGRRGSGRSSLLLTLAGRMIPTRDTSLTVLGLKLPRQRNQVQRKVGIVGFSGIDDLDQSVSISQAMTERFAWLSPWYRRVSRPSEEQYRRICAPVFGPRPAPPMKTVIWNLDELDSYLLRTTLATLSKPEAILFDHVDQLHNQEDRKIFWERTEEWTSRGLTVVASTGNPSEASHIPNAPFHQIEL